MNKLPFSVWLSRTEAAISAAIRQIEDREWDENLATWSWMNALRQEFQKVQIIDNGQHYAVAWDMMKLKGAPETSYGDIGVLIRFNYPNKKRVEGVGFIEAKRVFRSGRYESMDATQLDRMHAATAHHRLGFYERKPIMEAVDGLARQGAASAIGGINSELSDGIVAAVAPTGIALRMKSSHRDDLHPLCIPLSYQICARYFQGYDLDLAPDLLEAVKQGGLGSPKYLVLGNVEIGTDTDLTTDGMVDVGPDGPYDAVGDDNRPSLRARIAENLKKKRAETQRRAKPLIEKPPEEEPPRFMTM
jgi:hypothetical protein